LCTSLSLAAAQQGVQLVPGSRFGVDGTLERFLRIPFALPPEQLTEAVPPHRPDLAAPRPLGSGSPPA